MQLKVVLVDKLNLSTSLEALLLSKDTNKKLARIKYNIWTNKNKYITIQETIFDIRA